MAYYAVYKDKIKNNIEKLKSAFVAKNLNFQLFYSVKTNSCTPVLTAVKESNCEFEIISDLEWEKVKVFNPSEVFVRLRYVVPSN